MQGPDPSTGTADSDDGHKPVDHSSAPRNGPPKKPEPTPTDGAPKLAAHDAALPRPIDLTDVEPPSVVKVSEPTTITVAMVPGIQGKVLSPVTQIGEALKALGQSIIHPSRILTSFRDILKSLKKEPNEPREISDIQSVGNVTSFVKNSIARIYLSGLAGGAIIAGLLTKDIKNQAGGALMANGIDYAICTAIWGAGWLLKNKDFYYDRQEPELASKRRTFMRVVFAADAAVSAAIYGITLPASNLAQSFFKICADYPGPTTVAIQTLLFLTIAGNNINNCAHEMVDSFKDYWKQCQAEKPEKLSTWQWAKHIVKSHLRRRE